MTYKTNPAIQKFSQELDMDYPLAVGIFVLLSEMDDAGTLDGMSNERVTYELGFMSHELSHELSQKCSDIRSKYRSSKRYGERIKNRDRQRAYRSQKRERETGPLDGPSSPTPLSPPLSPSERKREGAPNALRALPPEGDKQTATRRKAQRFVKPTLDELKAYAAEIGFERFDPYHFLDYYDQVGWTIGRDKPMKDWKATVRNWKRRDDERRGVTTNAEHRRDTEEDPLAGFSPEDIEEIRRIANDGKHWG